MQGFQYSKKDGAQSLAIKLNETSDIKESMKHSNSSNENLML